MKYHNIVAEQAIIGCILIDNRLVEKAVSMLSVSDFYYEDTSHLFSLCIDLAADGQDIDVLSLSSASEKLPSGAYTIGVAADIQRHTGSASSIEGYCRAVRECANRRQYRTAMTELARAADGDADIHELASEAMRIITDITTSGQTSAVKRLSDYSRLVVEGISERMESGGKFPGLLTGLVDLDKLVRGLRDGNMVTIAGRPGSGKTTLGMQIAELQARHGAPVLVFSQEMPGIELAERLLASIGKIPLDAIHTGQVADHTASITAWKGIVDQMPMYISDTSGMTIADIRAVAKFHVDHCGVRLVIIDHIGLIRLPGKQPKVVELGDVSKEIKRMAKTLGIPVVTLCQMNRKIESTTDRDPVMSDLRDCGDIEQDSDVVLFSIPQRDEDGVTKMVVAKNRHAPTGTCFVAHRGDISRFDNMMRGSR